MPTPLLWSWKLSIQVEVVESKEVSSCPIDSSSCSAAVCVICPQRKLAVRREIGLRCLEHHFLPLQYLFPGVVLTGAPRPALARSQRFLRRHCPARRSDFHQNGHPVRDRALLELHRLCSWCVGLHILGRGHGTTLKSAATTVCGLVVLAIILGSSIECQLEEMSLSSNQDRW
jgi:hypothetical protein